MNTLLLQVLAPLLGSVPSLPFPFDAASPAGADRRLVADESVLAALEQRSVVRLTGFPASDGSRLELELERVHVATAAAELFVDGQLADVGSSALEHGVTFWRGRIAGLADSDVFMAFSKSGSRGWVARAAGTDHLLPEPDPRLGWAGARAWIADDETLLAQGAERAFTCSSGLVSAPPVPQVPPASQGAPGRPSVSTPVSPGAPLALGVAPPTYECPIPVETDWQYYTLFNDLDAARTYALTLFAAVSARYQEQIQVAITLPYLALYTANNDPWVSQDNGLDCVSVLFELQAAWSTGMPQPGALGHLLSGADLGCGVAWLDVLCLGDYSFAVSGNLHGQTPFPISVGPLNWDFVVTAHEIGHNFNAIHTHDYCPPLDECAPAGYFGVCQTQQTCTSAGTVMSYCHLCFDLSYITTYFHAQSAADMRARVESSCLLPLEGVQAFENLGLGLSGVLGKPQGTASWLPLANALVLGWSSLNGPGFGTLVAGGSRIDLPLFGGTLVPSPDILLSYGSAAGSLEFSPFAVSGSYPGGVELYLQNWFVNSASFEIAASDGYRLDFIVPDPPPALVWKDHPTNGLEYSLTAPVVWLHADSLAQQYGGELALLDSAATEAFLATNFKSTGQLGGDAWISLTDNFHEGVWTDANDQPLGYTNWAAGEPNDFNGFEDAGAWLFAGQWNDADGYSNALPALIQRPQQ